MANWNAKGCFRVRWGFYHYHLRLRPSSTSHFPKYSTGQKKKATKYVKYVFFLSSKHVLKLLYGIVGCATILSGTIIRLRYSSGYLFKLLLLIFQPSTLDDGQEYPTKINPYHSSTPPTIDIRNEHYIHKPSS